MSSNTKIRNLTFSAMFLALGMVLPFMTGQVPKIGSMLLPMHIPVLLCGFICGWQYGALVGLILPMLRYAVFGMPILFPTGIAMSFELLTYGLVSGWLYARSQWHCIRALYRCLWMAMICGRLVWGVVQWILLGISGTGFTVEMFFAGAVVNAIPGIILQLILIPSVMLALHKTGLVPFSAKKQKESMVKIG